MEKFILGKKVEKNIRYVEETDTYYVQFNFRDVSHLKSFPTLEDARTYRDAVNAEKLRIKTQEVIEEIRKHDKEEIYRSKDVYPYNALESAGISDIQVPPDLVGCFSEVLIARCTDKEKQCIELFYRDRKTLSQIGEHYNLSRERIRQIIGKGLRKIKYIIYNYENLKKEEQQKIEERQREEKLQQQREELIEAFREKGIITEDIAVYFGQPQFEAVCNPSYNSSSLTIEDLDLSVRSYNCLRRAGIRTISELISKTENELYHIRNMGKKSLKEIKEKLISNGFTLSE